MIQKQSSSLPIPPPIQLFSQSSLSLADQSIILPQMTDVCAPMAQMIMAQMFAYYTALDLGRNIDRPRNLAKSVTVG